MPEAPAGPGSLTPDEWIDYFGRVSDELLQAPDFDSDMYDACMGEMLDKATRRGALDEETAARIRAVYDLPD